MKKWKLFFLLLSLLLCVFTSCRTKVETVTEYIPVELDIETLIQPVLELRPPTVMLRDVSTLSDAMQNSVAFQKAYMNWRDYALTLESFYLSLND